MILPSLISTGANSSSILEKDKNDEEKNMNVALTLLPRTNIFVHTYILLVFCCSFSFTSLVLLHIDRACIHSFSVSLTLTLRFALLRIHTHTGFLR